MTTHTGTPIFSFLAKLESQRELPASACQLQFKEMRRSIVIMRLKPSLLHSTHCADTSSTMLVLKPTFRSEADRHLQDAGNLSHKARLMLPEALAPILAKDCGRIVINEEG